MSRSCVACVVACLSVTGVLRAEPVPTPQDGGKIHRAVYDLLNPDDDSASIKAWVLFDLSDKGVTGDRARAAAFTELAATYNPRAIQRRNLRRTRPGLFDIHDLPVVPAYVDSVRATGAAIHVVSRWLNGVSVRATKAQLERIEKLDFVRIIQPVRRGRRIEPVGVKPSETAGTAAGRGGFYGESEPQLIQMGLTDLHAQGHTGSGVLVGVLDTGFNRSHAAFNEVGHLVNVVAEWDFINSDGDTSFEVGDPDNQHNHGTYILGTLGAYKPTELVGAAYDASFILCKTEDTTDEYPGEEDNYVGGLEFIEANGGDMATASLTYKDWYTDSDYDGVTAVTTIGVNIATGNGVHCLSAASNAGHDADPATANLGAPADSLEGITCGAVDDTGVIAGFSSDGPSFDGRVKPEVLARGVDTRTVAASNDVDYVGVNGTSLSTPLLAGAVACLVDAHPDWTVEQMRAYLFHTADYYVANGTYDPEFVLGYGIINAVAASAGDCDNNGVADVDDITAGTHLDCNGNAIPDACDITQGRSEDIDGNGVPDECFLSVPTVSHWGLAVMVLLVMTGGTAVFGRRARRFGIP